MGDDKPFVTIVSGLPRSGTSMMMQILEAGGIEPLTDRVRIADDDNPKGYYELEAVKKTKQDSSWLADAPGKAVKLVHLLLYDLPGDRECRVVFMRRKMQQVLASQQTMLKRQNRQGSALPAEKLGHIFADQLDKMASYLDQQSNIRALYVDYNRIIADAGPLIDQINEFLGGLLDTDAMQKIVDPDLYRQRA
jgi:hypothetical protein